MFIKGIPTVINNCAMMKGRSRPVHKSYSNTVTASENSKP